MSDSANNFSASSERLDEGEPPPQFGLLDVIEAFTAMRHECRGQAKESRTLVESVRAAVSSIEELDTKLTSKPPSDEWARKLAELVAETDMQLTRAVEAVTRADANRREQAKSESTALKRRFESMNTIAKWFSRPLLAFVNEQHKQRRETTESTAVEALNLILVRLRQMMNECEIERVDVLGQMFEPETMNAIGTLASQDYASGHVADQIAPAYRWRGILLRYADVRVSS